MSNQGVFRCMWALAAGLAVVFAVALPAAAEDLDLTLFLDPAANPDTNRFEVDYTVAANGDSQTQSTTTDASGNVLASMDIDFDPVTQQATVNTISFGPGSISLTNMSLAFNVDGLLFTLNANGLGGYINTAGSPSNVVSPSGNFLAADHEVVVDQGLISTVPPTISHDLSLAPITSDLVGATANIDFALGSFVNNVATYNVTLTLPTEFSLMFEQTVNIPGFGDIDFDETLNVDGAIIATGTYVRQVPEPGAVVLALTALCGFAFFVWRVRRQPKLQPARVKK